MKSNNRIPNNYHITLLAIVLLIIAAFGAGCKNATPDGDGIVDLVSLLPDENDISGWSRDGNAGEYNSIGDLYDAIDGEAQVYSDYGFREAVVQEYTGPDAGTITLMISDQTDAEGSTGLYEELTGSNQFDISDLGEEARGTLFLFDYFVEFRCANYYVTVRINGITDIDQQTAESFGSIVDSNIELI